MGLKSRKVKKAMEASAKAKGVPRRPGTVPWLPEWRARGTQETTPRGNAGPVAAGWFKNKCLT